MKQFTTYLDADIERMINFYHNAIKEAKTLEVSDRISRLWQLNLKTIGQNHDLKFAAVMFYDASPADDYDQETIDAINADKDNCLIFIHNNNLYIATLQLRLADSIKEIAIPHCMYETDAIGINEYINTVIFDYKSGSGLTRNEILDGYLI